MLVWASSAAGQIASPSPDRDRLPTVAAERSNRPTGEAVAPGTRRIEFYPRGSTGFRARSFPDPKRNEQITVIEGGVQMIVRGLSAEGPGPIGELGPIGTIDVSTDRLVIWTPGIGSLDLSAKSVQPRDMPLEIYMEGNIVFRQGDRVIYARSMYYDVSREKGIVLGAEMLTPAPKYQGLLRLKADVLQEMDRHRFQAFGASITSSRMGVPGYWFQSQNMTFQDIQQPLINPLTGRVVIDPFTEAPAVDHQILATARNNFLYLGGVPIFYWPVMATDATKPNMYLDRIRIRNDSVFGTQLLTDWDVYQLLGVRKPPAGTDWTTSLDLMSDRGIGFGTGLEYERTDLFGIPGPYHGLVDAWGIDDQGVDDLGRDRRAVPLEKDFRGRILWQHRHYLADGFELTGEFGFISDRNFLEQYFESEWDDAKDQRTGIELKRRRDNSSWSAEADFRLNDFFTQTEWLPRADHFLLGQPVLWDRLTWHEHSQIGYARLETADPAPGSLPLRWETDGGGARYAAREGVRAATRQELDLPLQLGPVKVVPYVLGELAYWGEDRTAADVTRAYGQLGARASIPIWKVDPNVQNVLLNLNGLAHKVVFDAEFLWADANRNLGRFPLYDRLDDDSIETFRRLLPIPPPLSRFDARRYALRTGMQSWVTAPSTEIADDLSLVRLGVRQRWQTKRGFPGQERIIDWITLDIGGGFFPKPDRDNFGQDLAPLDYNFRWHVGDRLSLVSDGYFDFFSQGLRSILFGGFISRPERGSLYLGYRSIEGPISSNILDAALHYRMSDKWIATYGGSIDMSDSGNVGQYLNLTRIGESFLVSVGLNVDESRKNVGAHLNIEPRFLSSSRTGRVGGVQIPPAGAMGLE